MTQDTIWHDNTVAPLFGRAILVEVRGSLCPEVWRPDCKECWDWDKERCVKWVDLVKYIQSYADLQSENAALKDKANKYETVLKHIANKPEDIEASRIISMAQNALDEDPCLVCAFCGDTNAIACFDPEDALCDICSGETKLKKDA